MHAWVIILGAIVLRLLTVALSARNIKRHKENGAREYGAHNSRAMTVLHTLFYLACLVEAVVKRVQFDALTMGGLVLYAFSALVLRLVIRQLGSLWTIKLMIAQGHTLNESFVFKYVRHPNYFLNVVPELLSMALIGKAWVTLALLCLPYLVILLTRVVQEEEMMSRTFPTGWSSYWLLDYLPRSFKDWAKKDLPPPDQVQRTSGK